MSRAAWADALVVVGVKSCATAFVLLSGFRAVSDDDFARVVLSQRFAHSPAIDPTGSSWLPFPFYLYGVVQAALGSSLSTARTLAVFLGLLSALLVWGAARVLGLPRRASLIGAAIAAALPSAAYLGAATVPEAPTAGLCVFGAACLSASAKLRGLGAVALFVACGSRYEAWGVAGVYALVTFWDALRERDARLALAALVSVAFPMLWLLHGIFRHGDATFFVARVTEYRSALGPDAALWARFVRAPLGFVAGEPELSVLLATLGLPVLFRRQPDGHHSAVRRSTLALGGLVLLVVLGDVRGSAPTHHENRALLAAWLGAAVLVGHALELELRQGRPTRLRKAAMLAALSVGLGAAVRFTRGPEFFADRRHEEDIGRRARERHATPLAIDAEDFGYLAIQAALGASERTLVLDERDPRKPRTEDLLKNSPEKLAAGLRSREIRWLVTPQSRLGLTRTIGDLRDSNAGFALVQLK